MAWQYIFFFFNKMNRKRIKASSCSYYLLKTVCLAFNLLLHQGKWVKGLMKLYQLEKKGVTTCQFS